MTRAKAKSKKKKPGRKEALTKTILRLPGYDPRETAGKCWFDIVAAQLAIDFYSEVLTHTKGALAGEPFVLELWQKAIIANLFGWKKPDGTRRYREAVILVPRKNGKTTLAAGIAIQLLFLDREPGAEIYSAAADRAQASLVFNQAKRMVKNDPDLSARAVVFKKSIIYPELMGSYMPISAEAYSKHGYNSHGIIFDELHAQPTRDLNDVLTTSTGSRTQPLIVYITTQDYERPSICNEKVDYARNVRDGIIKDPAILPALWEATIEDDWNDPAIWAKANPNLGVSVSKEYFKREYKRAKETPTYENAFKRFHLNIKTAQETRFISIPAWDKCAGQVDPEELRGKECFAGLDMSSTIDLSALVLFFPSAGNAVLPFFWIPKDCALQRERRDRVPYLTWAREGFIETTPGNVVDYDIIRRRLGEINEIYNILEIAIDRWNTTQLQTQLMGDGFEVVQFGQGYASMSAPTKELEKLIISENLRHGANPVLRWNANNVTVTMDAAGNLKPDKGKSAEKIDGIVSLIMAIGRSQVAEEEHASVYEERGILTI